jgi:hypothetical protein
MRATLLPTVALVWLSTCLFFLGHGALSAQAADVQFEAILVWGTDDAKPPAGKDYKPVEPELRNKFKKLFKWSNYFEVRRKPFNLVSGINQRVEISPKCQLDVKDSGNSGVEVVLFGQGKEVARQKQALPKGELLVLGGDAPNSTAWLVVIKRLQ